MNQLFKLILFYFEVTTLIEVAGESRDDDNNENNGGVNGMVMVTMTTVVGVEECQQQW